MKLHSTYSFDTFEEQLVIIENMIDIIIRLKDISKYTEEMPKY